MEVLGEGILLVSDRSTQEKLPGRSSDSVVGMEYEVEKLLRESVLNEQKKGLSIAVVEGIAGIGKTTFAQKIYNHPDVVNRFPHRAWAMVSSKFTLEGTMKQLILGLPGSDKQKLRELEESEKDVKNELQEILYKLLQGQTYFIVLDDVREMDHCESLKSALPNEQDKTSRLLVTTRSKYIAKSERYTHYEMKLLDPEKSWELFLKKALISDGGCPEELKPIGREIVRRCEGLPLKISKVGGLLVQTRSKRGWQQVLNLENLSPELRQCFLYLGLFNEYATIPAKTLLHTWLVQGFIEVQQGQKPEEKARRCLDELISQNMLQIVDWTMGSCARNVYLHGILREECLRIANEELYLETENTPHAVVSGANIGTLSLHQNKNLHSLFLRNDEGVDVEVSSVSHDFWKRDFWESCQNLNTLHLDGIKLSQFPDSLHALVELKYLMIRRHKIHPKSRALDHLEAVELPNWLGDLKHLEILDMEGEKVEFPKDVTLEMKKLRYFSANCVRGPKSINSWENIETLKYIRQEDWIKFCSRPSSSWIKFYSRPSFSCCVYKLGLVLDPLSKPEVWRMVGASLKSLKKLEHLQLWWNRFIPFDLKIFTNFGSSLTKLKLRGKLTKCPDMTIFPQNLTHLTLAFSDPSEDLMPHLSKLPKLSYLKLSGNAYKAETMQVLHGWFGCLKALSLREVFHLKSIDIKEGGMPDLKQLQIQQCPSLRTMNLTQGIVVIFIT